MCEGLIYGYKAGLNLEEVIAAVGAGAAGFGVEERTVEVNLCL